MTIRRSGKGNHGYSDRDWTGTGVPADTEAAQVPDLTRPFSDRGRRYFGDVGFPARREHLYRSAVAHGAPKVILDAIRNLPEEWYMQPDALPDLYELADVREEEVM